MIKQFIVFLSIFCAGGLYAQEGTSSPYSYYGLGLEKFKGTAENRAMGGLSMLADSIHLNLQNPAAYSELKLTTYTIGINYNGLRLENAAGDSSYADNGTLEYFGIGIPVGKFSFGFGVIPLNSVGYETELFQSTSFQRFSGLGGINKVYLSSGMKLNENLSIGAEFNYKFGTIENKSIFGQAGSTFSTREINTSDLSGVGFTLGLHYKTMVTEELELTTSLVSSPSFQISAKNSSEIASVVALENGRENVVDSQDINVDSGDFELPAELKVGAGIGTPKKWFLGAEYNFVDSSELSNALFSNDEVVYETGSKVKLGGYYIPNYRSLTSYFQRVVYRAGIRFENSGLVLKNEPIKEFGISFGLGLPVGKLFSNTNFGFEYGQRGTTDSGLVKENFFNISLSLSLNDQWFRKIKFN